MRVTIASQALIITSALKLEDLKFLKKTEPEALKVKDKNGNVLYAMDVKDGSLTKAGATFNVANAEGFAEATIVIPAEVAANKRLDWVKDNYAQALLAFEINEPNIQGYVDNIKAAMDAVANNITVL